MLSLTRTQSQTVTVTTADVRKVCADMSAEIIALSKIAAHVTGNIDVDKMLVDCSLFLLNDIVTTVSLQFYLNNMELVREYNFDVAAGKIETFGPPAGEAPTGTIPAGARVRLV